MSFLLKVFALDPSEIFLGMSSFRPLPKPFPYAMISIREDSFTDDEAIIISPTSDDRIELFDQKGGWRRVVSLDDAFDVAQELYNLWFCRFNEQSALVLSHVETEEIKTIVDMCDFGFVFREFESPRLEEFDNQRFDFMFEDILCRSGDNKVIGVSDEMNFMFSAKMCL